MSAKELGQIHTVNHNFVFNDDSDLGQIDLSGLLTAQLQNMIRQGQYFKMVGIDMTLTDFATPGDTGGQVSGFIDYFAPTRGRCEAYREAFAALRQAMKLQGIDMRDNKLFDFRSTFGDNAMYATSQQMLNVTTLDSGNPLSLIEPAEQSSGIFAVHNSNVQPLTAVTGASTFATGYNTMGVQATATNFVLNEGDNGYYANHDYADLDYESIPFQLTYTPGSTDVSVSFSWRPDPALYIAVMAGLLQVRIDEVELDGASALQLDIAVHIAGWKSIMGDPDKKKKRSSRGRRSRK